MICVTCLSKVCNVVKGIFTGEEPPSMVNSSEGDELDDLDHDLSDLR